MHVKNNINQGRFYIQGLRSFKDSLPKDVKKFWINVAISTQKY